MGGAAVNPMVSIAILSRDHWEYTSRALESLHETRGVSFETIVFDNGSMPEAKRALKDYMSPRGVSLNMEVVFHDQNIGVAGGRNAVANRCRGKFLLFLDNDVVIDSPMWLRRLLQSMLSNRCGIMGATLASMDDPTTNQFCGGGFDAKGNPCFWTQLPAGVASNSGVVFVRYCLGACLLVQRSVWRQLGGFDTLFSPMDYEDIDFCLRAAEQGVKIAVDSCVRVLHKGHVTTGATTFERMRCYLINGRRFKKRWQHHVAGGNLESPLMGHLARECNCR